jgi:hypothetical protein
MYVGRDWDPIDTGFEDDVFTLDFVNDLNSGETISSVAATIAVVQGTDPTPASRLSGAASFSGSKCSQAVDVRGGPSGVQYRLAMTVATNQRVAVTLWSHFWSRSPA